MKRTLLFSTTMLAVAGISVNAQVAVQPMNANLELSAQKVVNTLNKNVNLQKKNVMKAAAEAAGPAYTLPAGTFFWGPDVNSGDHYPGALIPAYHDVTFKNNVEGATSQEWEYVIYEGQNANTYYSEEKDLTHNYAFGLAEFPTLTVDGGTPYRYGDFQSSQGAAASTILTGGNPDANYFGGQNGMYCGLTLMNYLDANGLSLVPSVDNAQWQTWGKTTAKVKGFGLLFPKPAVPYALSRLFITFANGNKEELPITVYRVKEEDGKYLVTDEVIANGVTKGSYSYYVQETSLYEFGFQRTEGELTSDITLTVNEPVFIQVDIPADAAISPISLLTQNENAEGVANSYAVYEDGTLFNLSNLGLEDGSYLAALDMRAEIYYAWLNSVGDDYEYVAPVEGGSKTFTLDSFWLSDNFEVSDSQNALYDWVNCSFEDGENGGVSMVLDVTALSPEVKGRWTNLFVTAPGVSAKFTVTQGEASVDGVETSAVVVSVVDGNFVVKGSNASVVDVYNVAGQKVASAAVDGETVVNAQDLAKDMYILKFNDNTAIKVVK